MADKIEIVRLDAEGNVKETLHDDFPAGWSAARTEFGKLRHGEHGTAAAAEGGCLELRVGGVSKMSTKAVEKERKKRPSTKEAGGEKPKKKPAAKKTEDAPVEDDGEPKMKKQTGYMYHNAQNRDAAKAEIEAENPDLPAKEKNQAIMKKLADMWGKLDDAAKQKWKDDAPMVAVKPKKAKKEKKEPSEKRQSTGGKVTDKKALEERMAADGWTKEEKKREGSDHVDKYWLDPKGGKKCRSIVEVARKAYPEFLSEAAKAAAPTKKKPAAQKKKKPEPQAGALDDYYLGSKKKEADADAEMEDAPAAEPEAMDEDAPAEEEAEPMETEAPATSHAERAREAEKEDAAKRAQALAEDKAKADEPVIEDDGGAAAAAATADHRAAEAAWDAKERESDDPRAREAWAYRAKAKPMVDAVSVNETPADSSEADKKQAELVRKTWAVAHPPLDGTKAGETIVRTEADVADENVEA
jgi:hypothetical protein